MAGSCLPPTFETLTRTIKESGIVDDGRPLHLLMIGPPGVGKSSLAGVLINGVSEGVDGPDAGTTENIKSTKVRANSGSTYIVHDTRGLDGNEEQTQRTIDEMKRIIINEKCIAFVCVRWDARFTDCEKTFKVTNQLSPDIWEKAVIVLTHSDSLSPDVRKLPVDQQHQRIEELNERWKENIKAELSRLGVNEDTLDKLKICNTSHTSIDENLYSKYWLQGLIAELLKILPSSEDVTNFILSQIAYLHPEQKKLVDSYLSSIHDQDINITPVDGPLENIPTRNSTTFSKIGKACALTGTTMLSGSAGGACVGALAGGFLCHLGVISASVAIGASVGAGLGAGVGAGLGLLFGLCIVGAYILYKRYSKKVKQF